MKTDSVWSQSFEKGQVEILSQRVNVSCPPKSPASHAWHAFSTIPLLGRDVRYVFKYTPAMSFSGKI